MNFNAAVPADAEAWSVTLARLLANDQANQLVDDTAVLAGAYSRGIIVKWNSAGPNWTQCDGTASVQATDIIGIVEYALGTAGVVRIGGVYVDNTNLTANTLYYCQANGTLGTTATQVFMGRCTTTGRLSMPSRASGGGGGITIDTTHVLVCSASNLALTGIGMVIDGYTVAAGVRVLAIGQTTGSQNGIYVTASGSWSRASDLNASAQAVFGLTITVDYGQTCMGSVWMHTTAGVVTLGTTSLVFTLLAPSHGSWLYTVSGTFYVPVGIGTLRVTHSGGGGGGGGGSGGGNQVPGGAGAGADAKMSQIVAGLVPGAAIAVTVGAAGTAGTGSPSGSNGTTGGTGGTTSFGAYSSSAGGGPGTGAVGGSSGNNGAAGGPGGAVGGWSVFGQPGNGNNLYAGANASGNGGGGGGGSNGGSNGGAGTAGFVLVEW